jgi:hypothetical protein
MTVTDTKRLNSANWDAYSNTKIPLSKSTNAGMTVTVNAKKVAME